MVLNLSIVPAARHRHRHNATRRSRLDLCRDWTGIGCRQRFHLRIDRNHGDHHNYAHAATPEADPRPGHAETNWRSRLASERSCACLLVLTVMTYSPPE